jgi:hypothetical protein
MKTDVRLETVTRIAAGLMLTALALGGAGCATTGSGETPESGGAMSSPTPGAADFYADWYDASAVVLPPPPQSTTR